MKNAITCLIPARGGSKGIPRKNVLPLNGKPLIVHSIETAFACRLIDRVVVSTDDTEIAGIAEKAGAEVPFLRPAEISLDETPDLPVFEHFLKWCRENSGSTPELLVHLRPTSPLRSPKRVDQAIQMLIDDPKADCVRAVCVPSQNPFKMWTIDKSGWLQPLIKDAPMEAYNLPRQVLPPVFWQTGYVDVIRSSTVSKLRSMTGRLIKPLLLDSGEVTDIDDLADWAQAADRLNRNLL